MKGKREYVLLVLVIAALSAYLVLHKTDETHYRLPAFPKIERGDLTRITIRKGDSECTLQRDDDHWVILPGGYPAERSAVDSMLEVLEGFRLTALASSSGNDAVYDLDETGRILVTAFRGDDALVSVAVGKTAPSHRHTFVKLEGDSRIYHAEKNFRATFDKDVSALRDKQVLKIDEEISEVILAAGPESVHIVRATAPVAAEPGQEQAERGEEAGSQGTSRWETLEGKPVKGNEIDGLVKTLSNIKCDDYLERKKEDLKDASFRVSLKGLKNYEFTLYDEQGGRTVATSSESEYPFLIAESKAKRIRKNLKDLVESKE
jgi:Domain of unknown function (DUF4340)